MDHHDDDSFGIHGEKTDPGFPARIGERDAVRGVLRPSERPPFERTDPNFLLSDAVKAALRTDAPVAMAAMPAMAAQPETSVDSTPTPARGFARNQLVDPEGEKRSKLSARIAVGAVIAAGLVLTVWVARSGRGHEAEKNGQTAATPGTTLASTANTATAPEPTAVAPVVPAVTETPTPPVPTAVAAAKSKDVSHSVKAPAKKAKAKKPKDLVDRVAGGKSEDKDPAEAPLPEFPVPAALQAAGVTANPNATPTATPEPVPVANPAPKEAAPALPSLPGE